jgi:hypothetical protein
MRGWMVGVALAASGCIAGTSVQTAHPIGKGNIQVGVEPGIYGASANGSDGTVVLPAMNVAIRYGVTDRLDIGGRLGTGLYELTGKYQVNDPAAETPIAIAPSTSFFAFGTGTAGAGYWDFRMPVLFGFPAGRHELVVGPRVHNMLIAGGDRGLSGAANFTMLGGQAGFALRLGDNFQLLPEVSVEYPVLAIAGSYTDGASATDQLNVGDGTAFSFTLGFLLGGK